MSEQYVTQKKQSSNFRQLLQERIEKANPRRKLTVEETKRLAKLEEIADKLRRDENVQNRQLQTWLSADEYAQIEAEWDERANALKEVKRLCKEFGFTAGMLKGALAKGRSQK